MENNGCDEVMAQQCGVTTCPEATVEIKIKTLNSQTYTLRVDKCVPVPALKEQVATVTGVLSGEQRLICRGRVLKDDELLSAYHVEDGHTLHLVVRQPIHPSLDSSVNHSADDSAPSSDHRVNQFHPSAVAEALNTSEPGGGLPPGLSQMMALFAPSGVTTTGSGTEGANLGEAAPEGLSRSTRGGLRNSGGQQTDHVRIPTLSHLRAIMMTDQSIANGTRASAPLDPLQLPVIQDSLPTLSQYLATMINEFTENRRDLINSTRAADFVVREGQGSDAGARSATLASLADVILSTRQLLAHQTTQSLTLLARLLEVENQANVTDHVSRLTTESFVRRSGFVLQHLGAFLLELGRVTTSLQMGPTPAEAVVNAEPAVFISASGPNPIMVQPLHTQPGASGTEQHGSGTNLPRSIDIRMHTASQGEATGTHQHQGQSNRSAPEPPVRGIPISIAALPARSRVSVGLLVPVRHVSTDNLGSQRGPRSSQGARSVQQPDSRSTVPPVCGANVQGTTTTRESEPVSGNGDLFSHLLQQMMPMISENTTGGSAAGGDDAQTSSTQGQESTERDTRRRGHENPPSSSSSKRQRR